MNAMDADEGFRMVAVLIPIVSVIATFTFITLAIWFKHRSQERAAFYKAEMLRRITEASGESAKAALEMMREDDRLKRVKAREGMKIGGLVNIGVGLALIIFLRALIHDEPVYLCGLIPGFVGIALLIYSLFLAPPLE
ncbi:MAG: DUF6249 domain-containing protein [Terracidiphilus sp.]